MTGPNRRGISFAMARDTEQRWRKRVEQWKSSGLSAAEFAQRAGLNRHTLQNWNWRLNAQHKDRPHDCANPREMPHRVPFVEVALTRPTASAQSCGPAQPLELVLPDGSRLRIPPRFDPDALRRVLALLGGP